MKQYSAAVAMVLMSVASAFAQTTVPPRVFVSVNGGMQVTTNDFGDGATFTEYAEPGRLDTDYTVDGGPALNIGGGAVVWRSLGVGAAFARFSKSTPANLTGSVPHPFFFNRNRDVSGEVGGLTRAERAIHVRASTLLPVGNRMQLLLFGGPSFFRVEQDLVTDLVYAEEYPYDTASLTRAETTTVKESTVGFNAGADLGYFVTRQLGVGVLFQYSGATVELRSAGGGTQDVKAGGVQAGGGVRLRF